MWSKAKGEFELQPALVTSPAAPAADEPLATAFFSKPNGKVWTSLLLGAALSSIEADEFRSDASFQEFPAARSQLSQRILSSSSPMRYLPGFVVKWSSQLDFFSEKMTTTAEDHHCIMASLSEEYLELAQTRQSMGEIQQARGHLGKCIALERRRQQKIDQHGPTAVLDGAKKALFACIKFQESLIKCQQLLLRAKMPPQILAFLVREIERLSSQAPFSIQLCKISTDLLWKTHQYTAIVSSLTASSLTNMDVHLTLLHARALETQGLYQQSLAVASQWYAHEDSTSSDNVAGAQDDFAALLAHKERLKSLLESNNTAEQLQREANHEEASNWYSQSLRLLANESNRIFHASLLLSRANMTLMLVETSAATSVEITRLSSAIDDIRLSLKLNPSNQLAKLRLDTALLQLETLKLKSRMKITK